MGCDVAFATGEPFVTRARADGFEAFRAGPDESFRSEWALRFPGWNLLVGDEQRKFFFSEIFANLELVPRAEDLESIIDRWAPNVVVHEVAELAAPLICSTRDIPYVDVSYGALIERSVLDVAGAASAPHWRKRGLDPSPTAGLFRHLYIDSCPPALQNPEIHSITNVQRLRPAAATRSESASPPWLDRIGDGTLIYLTLGTVFNQNLDIFRCAIEALRDDDLTLVVTVGRQNDPYALGPQPANVIVERFIPQGTLLPRCSAVITHGGSGTTLGALGHGVPLLVLPQGADQYANAARVVQAGAGLRLLAEELTPAAVRSAVHALLDSPSYQLAAVAISAEMEAMPDVPAALARIRSSIGRTASGDSDT